MPTAAPRSLDSVGAVVPLRGGTPRNGVALVGLMMVVLLLPTRVHLTYRHPWLLVPVRMVVRE